MFGRKRRGRRAVELARLEILGEKIRREAERRREPDICRGCVRMEMAGHPGMSEAEATRRVRNRRKPSAGLTMETATANIAHNLGHPGADYPPQGARPSTS